jgi:hypothetical protein
MRELPDDYRDRLEAKLAPVRIRSTLSFAGLLMIVYELVKQIVMEDVRGFYLSGFDEKGMLYDEEGYAQQVTSLDKSKFRASAKWLVNSGAITDEQVEVLERLRSHRNDIAHELVKYIIDPDEEPDADLFIQVMEVVRAITRFWTQVEIDIGTFEHHGDVTPDDAQPLSMIILGKLIDAYIEGLPEAGKQSEAQPQADQQAETSAP